MEVGTLWEGILSFISPEAVGRVPAAASPADLYFFTSFFSKFTFLDFLTICISSIIMCEICLILEAMTRIVSTTGRVSIFFVYTLMRIANSY